jgi:hypothetical protein
MNPTTTNANSTCLLTAAAQAGRLELSEDYDDLLADLERRKPQKGFTAALRRETGAVLYARGTTPDAAVRTLYQVVSRTEPPAERLETILRLVGEPRRPIEMPAGLL